MVSVTTFRDNVDQLLASEELSYDSAGAAAVKEVAWPLAEEKGSVRDIVFASYGGANKAPVHFKCDYQADRKTAPHFAFFSLRSAAVRFRKKA